MVEWAWIHSRHNKRSPSLLGYPASMATLHLDGSANGSILLDLHAGGLAQPSLFIIHTALFPDSMLILAL